MKEISPLNIRTILFAEDDEDDFNFFYSAILSLLKGVYVLRTNNGMMLTSIIETSIIPDVIFLDLNMPFKNGISCLKTIRSNEKYNKTKVIIYSTSTSVRDIDTCYAENAFFYLIKPSFHRFIAKQLDALFNNSFFINNKKPTRDHFVIDAEGKTMGIV